MAAGMFLSLSLSRVAVATASANPIKCTRHNTKRASLCKQVQDTHTHAQAFAQGHHKHNTRAPVLPQSCVLCSLCLTACSLRPTRFTRAQHVPLPAHAALKTHKWAKPTTTNQLQALASTNIQFSHQMQRKFSMFS